MWSYLSIAFALIILKVYQYNNIARIKETISIPTIQGDTKTVTPIWQAGPITGSLRLNQFGKLSSSPGAVFQRVASECQSCGTCGVAYITSPLGGLFSPLSRVMRYCVSCESVCPVSVLFGLLQSLLVVLWTWLDMYGKPK